MKSTKEFLFSSPKDAVLSEKLVSSRKRGKFCDIELSSCERAVLAHRAVLASFSPYLEQLFSNVDGKNVVHFQRYKYTTLENVIDYIYTGQIRIDKSSVCEVALLSRDLQLDDLHAACLAELRKDIHSNPFATRTFADKNSIQQLVNECDDHIRTEFTLVQQTKQFMQLPRLQVELFTNRQHSNLVRANDEEFLMMQVVEWVRRRLEEHGEKLQNLLEESRMVYLQPDHYLKDVLMEDCGDVTDLNSNDRLEILKRMSSREKTEIQNHQDHDAVENGRTIGNCKLIASTHTSEQSYVGVALLDGRMIAINLHHKTNKSRSARGSVSSDSSSCDEAASLNGSLVMLAPMALGKCSMGVASLHDKIYVIGGYNRGNCIHAVECYDAEVNDWLPIAPLPSARSRLCAVTYDDKLFVLGGSDGFSILNSVDSYDPVSGKWVARDSMCDYRSSFGAAVYGDSIYAIGGSFDSSALKSCEMFDGSTRKWSVIASLHLPRENVCVAECRGRIYAIGGSHGWTCHNTVEVFNPEEKTWEFASNMLSSRRGAAAVAICDKIIVAGGSDGRSALSSVEMYDPVTDTWQSMPAMLTPRNNPGLAVISGVLYVFGGFGGPSGTEFLNTVECFDEHIDDWKVHI